jgi:hypothetical protein
MARFKRGDRIGGIELRAWLCLLLAVTAFAAGCGSDNTTTASKPAQGPSPPGQASASSIAASQVARYFLGAAKSGYGAAACALMTDRAVAKTAHYVQTTGHPGFSRSRACALYFRDYQTNLGGALPSVEIGRVSVSGDRGEAEVVCPDCNRPRLLPLHLRKEEAGWRVDFDWRHGY